MKILLYSLCALFVAGCGSRAAPTPRESVIILCTGNSCRSQIAEAFWKKYGGDRWQVVSAGIKPKGEIYPLAIKVMAERGIDISQQKSKSVAPFVKQHFDYVVTVCSDAEQSCPTFANASKHMHWPFDDPPKASGTDEQKLQVCRRVRDEIEVKIKGFLDSHADN